MLTAYEKPMSHVIHVMIFDLIRSVLIDIRIEIMKYDGIYSLQTGKFYELKERRGKEFHCKKKHLCCTFHWIEIQR